MALAFQATINKLIVEASPSQFHFQLSRRGFVCSVESCVVSMDAPVAAAAAGGKMAEDTERLLNSVRNYAVLLCASTLAFGIAPRLAHNKLAPGAAPSATSNGYDASATAAVFTMATVLLQHILARVLERKTKAAPRLTPRFAWPLALCTWGCNTVFFLAYLGLGGAAPMGRVDWAAAAVASAVNLAMAVRTVAGHLA